LVSAVGIGLVLALFALIQALQRPVMLSQAVAGETAAPTSTPMSTRRASPTASAAPPARSTPVHAATVRPLAPTIDSDADTVAEVNGQRLDRRALQLMAAADRAMSQLFGQPLPAESELVDRLVNAELVWQVAQAAGFSVPAAQVSQALDAILAARGKTRTDLARVLAEAGLTTEAFTAYFGRLVTVDRFSQEWSRAQNQPVNSYVRQLQSKARTSFGPAAQASLTPTAAAPPTSRPSSPVAATPTITPSPTASQTGTPGVAAARPPRAETGQLAPDFSLAALNLAGAETLRPEDWTGRPVVLSFWTTWCTYCRRQTPVLVEAYRQYEPRGVQFIGINVKEERALVDEYVRSAGISYPVGLDADGDVAGRYQVSGFPTTYFIDASGRVNARHVGALTSGQVADYLARLSVLD
jgi:thiol-disulfide isomerase/thioredoxin